jgi:hypothetical protein
MSPEQLDQRALQFLERLLAEAPAGKRIVKGEQSVIWAPDVKRNVYDQFYSVLTPGTDIAVFLNLEGKVTGWRDDGRAGATYELKVDRDVLLTKAREELDLPADSSLGEARTAQLHPAGWTWYGVIFTAKIPTQEQVVKVWMDPLRMRIIQCLFGAKPAGTPLPRNGAPR